VRPATPAAAPLRSPVADWFFDSWSQVLRVLVVGALAYIALVIILRITGKRTLSKMNAFDFIITVALGSTLATILLSNEVTLLQGIAALAFLTFAQFLVTWLTLRSPRFASLVKSDPAMLVYRGRFLRAAMRRERVTEEEVLAAIRNANQASVEHVEAVVLETEGTLSVILRGEGEATALEPVVRPQEG
jgi:uncharacterized membrane protein YcaP (DUF421 family)